MNDLRDFVRDLSKVNSAENVCGIGLVDMVIKI